MHKSLRLECEQELAKVAREFIKEEDKVNSYLIRFHRLYLDGSYGDFKNTRDGGEKTYKLHKGRLSKDLKDSTMEEMALSTFNYFLAIEFFHREHIPNRDVIEGILKENLGEHYDSFKELLIGNLRSFKEMYTGK